MAPTPREQHQHSTLIRDSEKHILESLSLFPFATVAQIRELLFSTGSSSYASTLLRGLWQRDLVQRQALPSSIRAGSVPWIYSLATLGRRYLRSHGYAVNTQPYPSHVRRITDYDDLRHDLGVTDLLISGIVLARSHPDLALVRVIHDRTLHAVYRGAVIFDGWLAVCIREHSQQCIALEYERTVKDAAAFSRKVTALLEGITPGETGKSPYETLFGTTSLTIAYVTPLSMAYVLTMQQRIEQVLQSLRKEYEADVFRLLCVPPGSVAPDIWVQQVWHRPFTSQLVSVIQV